ncbi:hypothetical protein Avbf_04799 [Armadillidium vulgare]|nr:hypothetical protein Avbf_04799 [Armadillidium vulgare]
MRKRLSTPKQDRVLKRFCLKYRSITLSELKREWEEVTGVVASAVGEWMAQQSTATLTCLGNSPDLNPIENCWHYVSSVNKEKSQTLRELQEAIICD